MRDGRPPHHLPEARPDPRQPAVQPTGPPADDPTKPCRRFGGRKPDDGLAAANTDRPHVTPIYIDLAERGAFYTLYGNARRAQHPDIAERVWNTLPEPKRAQDPERRGVAIVTDLQRVVAQVAGTGRRSLSCLA